MWRTICCCCCCTSRHRRCCCCRHVDSSAVIKWRKMKGREKRRRRRWLTLTLYFSFSRSRSPLSRPGRQQWATMMMKINNCALVLYRHSTLQQQCHETRIWEFLLLLLFFFWDDIMFCTIYYLLLLLSGPFFFYISTPSPSLLPKFLIQSFVVFSEHNTFLLGS